MRRSAIAYSLMASVFIGSFLLTTGCSVNAPNRAPTVAQQMTILAGALHNASSVPYMQIQQNGTASVEGDKTDMYGIMKNLHQTEYIASQAGGQYRVQLALDDAPSIYLSSDGMWFQTNQKWQQAGYAPLTSPEIESIIAKLTTSKLHVDFQSVKVQHVNQGYQFTLVPNVAHQTQVFDEISYDLHRTMINDDPNLWPLTIAEMSTDDNLTQLSIQLTVAKHGGKWLPTEGIWRFGYRDPSRKQTTDVNLRETYRYVKHSVQLPDVKEPGKTTHNAAQHPDGQIISMTRVSVGAPGSSGFTKTYKMMYWSANTPTEAFVYVPNASGVYPLLVLCHGGYVEPLPSTHNTSPSSDLDLKLGADVKSIIVVPEYRGYAGSDGAIGGLSAATLDANNAIRAVMGRYTVEPNHVFVSGTSMGGGVALQLASERTDVRSVLAVSPFVGWDITGAWALDNMGNNDARDLLTNMTDFYGPYQPNSRVYQAESVNPATVRAPVLLLQGTADPNVPWQTVQTLYKEMKHDGKQVTLHIIPGGNHGLTGTADEQQVNQYIGTWYANIH